MMKLQITGMNCPHCVKAVSQALAEVPGVTQVVSVDLDSGLAEIEGSASLEELIAALGATGYAASQA